SFPSHARRLRLLLGAGAQPRRRRGLNALHSAACAGARTMRHPQNNNQGARMSYMAIKHIHLVAVGIGFALLLMRGFLMTTGSTLDKRRWMRIVMHFNYAVLFLAGIALSFKAGLKPGDHPWLMIKIGGLIVLLVLGASVLSRVRSSS